MRILFINRMRPQKSLCIHSKNENWKKDSESQKAAFYDKNPKDSRDFAASTRQGCSVCLKFLFSSNVLRTNKAHTKWRVRALAHPKSCGVLHSDKAQPSGRRF